MKIADGIRHALEQAQKEQQEKTAAADLSEDSGRSKLAEMLREAASNIRENKVDVRISDLQNLVGAIRGE
jgi:hypothetical protein